MAITKHSALTSAQERKYGRKTTVKGVMDSTAVTISIAPNPALQQPQVQAQALPQPTPTPASAASAAAAPGTPTKPANGLPLSPSVVAESITSDTDGTSSPTTPRTPSSTKSVRSSPLTSVILADAVLRSPAKKLRGESNYIRVLNSLFSICSSHTENMIGLEYTRLGGLYRDWKTETT